jgi:hypothetical protein
VLIAFGKSAAGSQIGRSKTPPYKWVFEYEFVAAKVKVPDNIALVSETVMTRCSDEM